MRGHTRYTYHKKILEKSREGAGSEPICERGEKERSPICPKLRFFRVESLEKFRGVRNSLTCSFS